MTVLFDSSVLVAAMVASHPEHGRSVSWLSRARRGEVGFVVASHSLAEVYAVLTTLPLRPRIAPPVATRLVRENIEKDARIVALSAGDYRAVLRDFGERGLSGGLVYDGLIARAAVKAKADRLLTLNVADFQRAWPAGAAKVTTP